MKKLIPIVSVYTFLVFIGCIIVSNVYGHLPVLIEGTSASYKFTRGLVWILSFLPAILISGYTLGFSFIWRKHTENSKDRFSKAMFDRYKQVLLSSLVFVLIISLNNEVFILSANRKLDYMKTATSEFEDAMTTASFFNGQNKPELAMQYAEQAIAIAPKDLNARVLYKEIQDKLDIKRDSELFDFSTTEEEKIKKPLAEANAGYTILELLRKSDVAARDEKWFEAHYWAALALQACSGTDSNIVRARDSANHAWNMLNKPVRFDNSVEAEYYKKKKEAYNAYNNGDNLKAYYSFSWLQENPINDLNDPDVERFLALSKENVETDYFFFDETENMNFLSNNKNVYFMLTNWDGSRDIYFMKSTMDLRKTSGYVRYIEELNIVHYTKDNEFVYSMSVPFAKVVAVPVTTFTDEALTALGIEKSWKYVPMIYLQSVDRKREGLICKPAFNYVEEGIPEELCKKLGYENINEFTDGFTGQGSYKAKPKDFKEYSMKIVSMKFDDFKIINETSAGPENMSIAGLITFLGKAVDYGFSEEVFNQNLVCRIVYPLLILLIFIFAASCAWNFRVEGEKSLFKFSWILLYPVFTALVFVLLQCVIYAFKIINYVIVGIAGPLATLMAFAFYAVIFVILSIIFLSRKAK